ncbi:hypothetical protein NPIL_91681 [Nephila pilipes]|uniref:Uncharacterized protein n=1 Tax=Nephila pilipes TaxID=299642 RepID=A0A8X6NY48_NEPPI|nr:hypothetical protein NPIL_91681 [Nephila pilipes]
MFAGPQTIYISKTQGKTTTNASGITPMINKSFIKILKEPLMEKTRQPFQKEMRIKILWLKPKEGTCLPARLQSERTFKQSLELQQRSRP